MSLLELALQELAAAHYSVAVIDDVDGGCLIFESDSVLGFVLSFPDASALIEGWQARSHAVLKASQSGLRRAEGKAWNTYLILLASVAAGYGPSVTLSSIEENLIGTRKIVRAGIATEADARAALLPLLAMQNAPQLEAVDMAAEIRLRTSELPAELMDAFVRGAADATLLQLLEVGQ